MSTGPAVARAPKTGGTFATMVLGTAFFAGVVGTFYYSRFRAHKRDDQTWIHRHAQQNNHRTHDEPGARLVTTNKDAEYKNPHGSIPLPGNSDNRGSDSTTGRLMSVVANRDADGDGKAPENPGNKQEPTHQRVNEANSHLYTKSIPFDVDAYNKRPEESKAGEM